MFEYNNGLNSPPTGFITDDGDNRLNLQGLEICRQWEGMNGGYTFNRTVFQRSDHSGIIRDESVLQTIESIVRVSVPDSGAISHSINLWTYQFIVLVATIIIIIF